MEDSCLARVEKKYEDINTGLRVVQYQEEEPVKDAVKGQDA